MGTHNKCETDAEGISAVSLGVLTQRWILYVHAAAVICL